MAFLLTGVNSTARSPSRIASSLFPRSGIDHTKCAKRSRIVRLTVHFFGELLSRILKGRASFRLITTHPSSNTLTPVVREWNVFVKATIITHIGQRALHAGGIVFAQDN